MSTAVSTRDLIPTNTKNARENAVRSFKKFIEKGAVSYEDVSSKIAQDTSGKTFIKVMDLYGIHLLQAHTSSSKPLSKNTILQYFGNVKNYFYDMIPTLATVCQRELVKTSQRLDKFASKRHDGSIVKKAPALTNTDLKCIVQILYHHATTEVDYADAALLAIMWYFFGRSSDTHMMRKDQIEVIEGGAMFLTFGRMKTSLIQGLSFFKHKTDFLLCPIHSVAASMVMQEEPTPYLVKCKVDLHQEHRIDVDMATLLTEDLFEDMEIEVEMEDERKNNKGSRKTIGIYAYVNCILTKVYTFNKNDNLLLTPGLTSQSFRRGAAQHANANPNLSAQWIGDRGGWQMSGMNKAFAYIFNTTKEDQKVSKHLSGWDPSEDALLPSLSVLSKHSQERLTALLNILFRNSTGFSGALTSLNIDTKVLDGFLATLLLHYTDVKDEYDGSPYIAKIEYSASVVGISTSELSAISSAIKASFSSGTMSGLSQVSSEKEAIEKFVDQMKQQARLIAQQAQLIQQMNQRLERIEAATMKTTLTQNETLVEETGNFENDRCDLAPSKKRKEAPKSTSAMWFHWYSTLKFDGTLVSRQRLNDHKHIVEYMKLFLPNGFEIFHSHPDYKTTIAQLGTEAEKKLLEFLKANGVNHVAGGSVLKVLKQFENRGMLDNLKKNYDNLKAHGKIVEQ